MGLLDSLKGMFGGGGDGDAIPVEETITEPAEPASDDAAEEPMSAPEPAPETAVEETPEPTEDEPVGGTEANMDAEKCGNCGADFGTCEHTAQPAMA